MAKVKVQDGLTSVITSQGDPTRDKLAATSFTGVLLSDQQINSAYKTSWMAKRLINVPARDALRNWRVWQGTPCQVKPLENAEKALGIQEKLLGAYKLARAQGGAALFIGTGDADLTTELDPATVKKGGLKYLTLLPRDHVRVGPLETSVLSAYYGKPSHYAITRSEDPRLQNIHPSRMVILRGEDHADPWLVTGATRGWGDSILQASYDTLRNSASTDNNIASLVFESNINIISVPELMAKLEDPRYEATLKSRLSLAAAQKGLHGDLLIDSEEKFERTSASFANLDGIMERFAVMVGATQGIPAVKFLGQMPKGIGSSAKGEMGNYYDDVKAIQTLDIQPALRVLDECVIRSAIGDRPDDISYLWAPLEQPTSLEIAETGDKLGLMAKNLAESGLYERAELREAVTNQLVNLDVLPALGDAVLASDADLDDDFNLDDDSNYGLPKGPDAPLGDNLD